MRPSGIGGMAVIEGVMMKNKDEYAVAVRKPDNEIVIEKKTQKSFSDKVKLFKLPILRGMLAFVDSMVIGVKILSYSASFFEEEEEMPQTSKQKKKPIDKKKNIDKNKKQKSNAKNIKQDKKMAEKKEETGISALMMISAVGLSIAMSIGFFMVLPFLVSQLLTKVVTNNLVLSLIEGVIRILIFIGYVTAISQMTYIKRVFMYHGAEHKTINCLENGFELNVENVKWQSKHHKRCGTSFMLIVMFISIIFFIFIPVGNLIMRIVSRILLVPIIAGVSYEFIRLAGKSDSKLVNILSKPGMWMQSLTTKEPDDSMIEVAIMSVEAVFDWHVFLEAAAAGETVNNKVNKKISKEIKKKVDITPVKPTITRKAEEEEDDILNALDKYLDFGKEKETSASAEDN